MYFNYCLTKLAPIVAHYFFEVNADENNRVLKD